MQISKAVLVLSLASSALAFAPSSGFLGSGIQLRQVAVFFRTLKFVTFVNTNCDKQGSSRGGVSMKIDLPPLPYDYTGEFPQFVLTKTGCLLIH